MLDDNSYVSGAMISDMASDVLLTCARKIPRLLRTHVYILEELFRPRLSENCFINVDYSSTLSHVDIYITTRKKKLIIHRWQMMAIALAIAVVVVVIAAAAAALPDCPVN